MAERKGGIYYEPIEQAPESPVVDNEFLYQGTRIEPAKPKILRLKKGNKIVTLADKSRYKGSLTSDSAFDNMMKVNGDPTMSKQANLTEAHG